MRLIERVRKLEGGAFIPPGPGELDALLRKVNAAGNCNRLTDDELLRLLAYCKEYPDATE